MLILLSFVLIGCPIPIEKPVLPTLTTSILDSITSNSVKTGGNITSDGGAIVTERGVCWNITIEPTIANNKTIDGQGYGGFNSLLSNLNPGVTYYIRAYATNSAGTAYGNEFSFTTSAILSTITTTEISSITTTSANSGGNITTDGGGAVTIRGVCWSTTSEPTIANSKTSDGTGIGNFTSLLTALTPATIYSFRAFATNSAGTAYGNEISFKTNANLPILTTSIASNIKYTSIRSGGYISSDGGALVTSKGVCWSTTISPTISNSKTNEGPGTGIFYSDVKNLTPGLTYFLRAYATNSSGTAYGNEVTFTLWMNQVGPPFTDVDANVYTSIRIGSQIWMIQNLMTTTLKDGTPIPLVTDNIAWSNLSTPGRCWYNNNNATYGALYNWYTVDTGKLCPDGWHVPSFDEWHTLGNYLLDEDGQINPVGGKLKETGTSHWKSPNTGATDESGFRALPGGVREVVDKFDAWDYIGSAGVWWTSTETLKEIPTQVETLGVSYNLIYNSEQLNDGQGNKKIGASVRCLKD